MFVTKQIRKRAGIVSLLCQSRGSAGRAGSHTGPARGKQLRRAAQPLALIADDSADDRWMIGRSLLRAGLQVIEVSSGEEVIQEFSQHRPHVVVLDLLMPHTGGLSACQTLRQKPGGEQLLIVVVSGLADAGTRHRAMAAGASAFVPKPAVGQGYDDLTQRICELLRERAELHGDVNQCAESASVKTD